MEISRPRDSTPQAGFAAFVDWLLAAAVALTVVVALVGIEFRIGGLSIRSHSAVRIAVVAVIAFAIRWRLGISSIPAWVTRVVMLTAICGSVATWFRFLLATIGGADSYGYVSAAEAIAHGRLMEAAPIAEWLSAENRMAIVSPLGWAPAPGGAGIVPTYPIGVSLVMAAFRLIGGIDAVYLAVPAMGLITLWLVYRLAREWFDPDTALFACALVAWNPLFITYAKQPMSDMAATMWVMLALLLAVRSSNASAFAAGLAAGAAVITRPVLLVAAALIPLMAHRVATSALSATVPRSSPRLRAVDRAAGLAIGVGVQMAIQHRLFGSPFSTGYGGGLSLFSWSHVSTNAGIFARHGWEVLGPLWIPGLVIGLFAARPEPRGKPLAILAAVTLPYLFYLPFDHWETLRFLLPGLVPVTVTAADGLMHIARLPRKPAVTAAVIFALLAITAGRSEILLRHSSVWDVASLEARYPLAGEWVNVNTPGNSVVLANQHSGSLRWYGKRQTLRWDFIAPEQLATTIRELQSHGATAYVAVEGDEVAMFEQRFAKVIDQLQVDHVGRVRNVSFLRLVSLPPNR